MVVSLLQPKDYFKLFQKKNDNNFLKFKSTTSSSFLKNLSIIRKITYSQKYCLELIKGKINNKIIKDIITMRQPK